MHTVKGVEPTISTRQTASDQTIIAALFPERGDEASFEDAYRVLRPQLLAYYRARGCRSELAEDLVQEVMFTVYRKAGQLRDRTRFFPWFFRIARNALFRHHARQRRQVDSISLDNPTARPPVPPVDPTHAAFEFNAWMQLLNTGEREVMTLRFVEEWEYHEIAAERLIPIGTLQWRVFNAKKKLAPHLAGVGSSMRKAA